MDRKLWGFFVCFGVVLISWRFVAFFGGPSDPVASAEGSTATFSRARLITFEENVEEALKESRVESDSTSRDETAESQSYDHLNLEQLVSNADLWDQVSLTEVSRQLRLLDEAQVGRFFTDALGEGTVERSRLIAIAEAYQGESLFNFWQKVVEIKPIREHDVFLNQDLYKATRAIRLISAANTEAKDFLERMTLDPLIHHNNLLLRKHAFFAIKEIDLAASARILRKLPSEDSLLREISAL